MVHMPVRATRTFHVEPALPPALEPLRSIALNLWWTWNTDATELFRHIDSARWEETGHNPVRLLQTLPSSELERLAGDDDFLGRLETVRDAFETYMSRPPQITVEGTNGEEVIAYFSLEFALTESLPNYSGGLGVLAGDHLKSASDLGLPLVGVGLLYQQGYFKQVLGPDGWQREEYQDIDLNAQPLSRARDGRGSPLAVLIPFHGRDVVANVWRLEVGQTTLVLLDTNNERNAPADRLISSRLYGGDIEMRIQQEMVLGIGGIRALRAMGYRPAVCHMNEGHSALLGVDRIATLMTETGVTFEEARLPVTAGTAFTTHTAVAAGIDLFPSELVRKYLGHYYTAMGLDDHSFIGLGRTHADDDHEPFSMALLGLRLSGYRNGVSRLHRLVSQKLWDSAWPGLPDEQIPIDSVTNGVHLPTWVSHELGEIFDRSVGRAWRDNPNQPGIWDGVLDLPDGELWDVHERQRERLVHRARIQGRDTAARQGTALNGNVGQPLGTRMLTIGFARRFASYKRATLLFRDPDRLARIVNDRERPVQFIFAGKAHPRDEPAKQLIREVVQHSRRPEFRDRLIVLERYDVELARALVQGCDVWLNTPLRPLEASGTSGMKSAANGGLNLSVLDGWWAEAYEPGLGWAVGSDRIDEDPEVQDAFDAESLYELLEHEVIPCFYSRGEDGVPHEWVAMMKSSIRTFAPAFNTSRMVQEYAEKAYAPAARSGNRLREAGLAPARELKRWLDRVMLNWDSVKILSVDDNAGEGITSDRPVTVTVDLHFGELSPDDARLDIVYGAALTSGEIQVAGTSEMRLQKRSEDGTCRYGGEFSSAIGGGVGYTIRLMPIHPDLHNPFATGLVRWA
jgi:glycogen phosphorylase